MVLIREEAFVYILIICIRLNRKDHLQLTNGERSFLGEGLGTQWQCWSQVSETSSASWVSEHPKLLKAGTLLFTFPEGLGCALNHDEVAPL